MHIFYLVYSNIIFKTIKNKKMSEANKSNDNTSRKPNFKKLNQTFNRFKGKGGFQNPNTGNSPKNFSKPKWKRDGADLGEYTYFIGDARQTDNYVKDTEAILNYVQRTYTHGSDVKIALLKMEWTLTLQKSGQVEEMLETSRFPQPCLKLIS